MVLDYESLDLTTSANTGRLDIQIAALDFYRALYYERQHNHQNASIWMASALRNYANGEAILGKAQSSKEFGRCMDILSQYQPSYAAICDGVNKLIADIGNKNIALITEFYDERRKQKREFQTMPLAA